MPDPEETNEEIAKEIRALAAGHRLIVLCNPVKGSPVPEAESGMIACASCGRAVWIGLTIWEALPENAEPMCLICAAKRGV